MNMMKRLVVAGALSLAVVAIGAPAHAQKQSTACNADIEKFCANVEKGQGRIMKCLQEHSKDLSADCKKAMESRGKAARERRAKRTQPAERRAKRQAGSKTPGVCDADINKYCQATKGKPDELTACMRKHKADFSAECREKVELLLKRIDEKKAKEPKS
jgi:hypothetical protein